MVFGCIAKNFLENIFQCLEKKKENTNQKMQNNTNQKNTSHKSRKTKIQNNTSKLRLVHSNIFTENASNQAKETKTQQKKCNQFFDRAARSTIAPLVGAVRSSDERRDLGSLFSLSLSDLGSLFSLSLSLSLSLFFRKLFEVKMRGETDFWVKGENIGQPEVILRKMIFSVIAKHAENGENDFLKSFSPKTNALLVTFDRTMGKSPNKQKKSLSAR